MRVTRVAALVLLMTAVAALNALAASNANAAVNVQTLVQQYSTTNNIVSPSQNSTSYSYVLGYSVLISVNNQTNTTVASSNASISGGPPIGGISVSYGLGYGFRSENYSSINASASEPSVIIVSPNYVTVTKVENRTITKTITKTITLANGSTTVVTKVKTVEIQNNSVFSGNKRLLAGVGVLAFFVLLVLARR